MSNFATVVGALVKTNLSPQVTDEAQSFYGISIDLDQRNRPIKSINDYQKEKEEGDARLTEIAAEIQQLQQEKEKLIETLKNKYMPQIKEQRNIIRTQEYELDQLEKQYQKNQLELETLKKRSEAERTSKLDALKADELKLEKRAWLSTTNWAT